MSARVCPFCNKALYQFEYYFCSSCGKKLPEDLIKPLEVHVSKRVLPKSKPKIHLQDRINAIGKRKIISFFLITLGIVCMILISVNLVPKFPGLNMFGYSVSAPIILDEKPEISEEYLYKVVDSQRELTSGSFGIEGFANAVPFDIVLYFEVFDVEWLLTNTSFFDETFASTIRSLNVPFCAFAYENEDGGVVWSLMFNVQGVSNVDEIFSELPSEHWKYKVVSDKIVVSEGEEVFDMVSKSNGGLTQSYFMNPFYAQAAASSPKEGQVLVVMSGYDGKKILETFLHKEEWKTISPLVAQILNLGYNEVVIR